jgi:hypothetical protein
MTIIEQLIETYGDEEFLVAQGFDEAIIGIDELSRRVVYSKTAILYSLMEEGLDYTEAIEHYNYNIIGSYVGEKTPIFVEDDWETNL